MEQLGGPLHLQATAASACAMVMNKRIFYLRGGNVNLSHNLSLSLSLHWVMMMKNWAMMVVYYYAF
ncbi:hypothetical protein MA16_Dca014152 [Dendrobium catenatum]|uniref:Uncharacterized protein n=1 Tax=Dendrobium catenatum TaxID=906689 RepID=A0A2I0VTK5_9ASPA|nr:hypothetical protein MA16_Dca014152 [Dendrobium catenatum]